MNSSFVESLEELLRGFSADIAVQYQELSPAHHDLPPTRKSEPATPSVQPRTWFSRFAEEQIMPLFRHTVEEMTKRGLATKCTFGATDGQFAAELVIVPPGLPHGARPPRLTIIGADGRRAVEVNYTGTFPHETQADGVGAEIGYDTIYPSQIEERILDFVRLATGA